MPTVVYQTSSYIRNDILIIVFVFLYSYLQQLQNFLHILRSLVSMKMSLIVEVAVVVFTVLWYILIVKLHIAT